MQSDDIVLTMEHSSKIRFLQQEAVVTEKLDGGNCSLYQGKVCCIRVGTISHCVWNRTGEIIIIRVKGDFSVKLHEMNLREGDTYLP